VGGALWYSPESTDGLGKVSHLPIARDEARGRLEAAMEDSQPSAAPRSDRWSAIALRLVVATMAYNGLEAAVALWSGFRSGSIALVGFGFDSVIELAAAGALLWRLQVEARGASHEQVEATEQRVLRFIGVTFLALAVYVSAEAVLSLWQRERPDESSIGIALAIASLVVMPLVAWGKFRAAHALRSESLRAEAKETLACSYLSLTLLVGLVANAVAGWWWADPAAALLMVPWLVAEGAEGVRGEDGD
jgi:divalent metal cation (Fe/Co/Zn/Cd) transporter